MRRTLISLTALALAASACGREMQESETTVANAVSSPYPIARRSDHVDVYFGTEVTDPYRWMEDLDSAELKTWVDAQNEISRPLLEGLPRRDAIRKRTEQLWSYERWTVPVKRGGRYFYELDDGQRNQAVLYYTHDLAETPQVAIDPNSFSDDGTIAMVRYNISPDGRYIAYGLSDGGSDWTTTRIRDLRTGQDLPEDLRHTKSGDASWHPDSRSFVYDRYPPGEDGAGDDSRQSRVFLHRLGTPQTEDTLVYEVTDHPRRNPSGEITEDGRFLVLTLSDGYFDNGVCYIDLKDPERTVIRLLDDWRGLYRFLGNSGRTFYFDTTYRAPNHRIVAIDLDRPERDAWREIVPETDTPIYASSLGGDHVILHYLQDAHSVVRLVTLAGAPDGEIELPGLGTVYGPNLNKLSSGDEDALSSGLDDDEVFFGFTDYTRPATVYRHSISQRQTELFRAAATDFESAAYETRQVFFESADGTRVPMFITHRKGLAPDGDQPTLLYGYGGFNVALTPGYSTSWAVWLEMGGVLAIPNLRGGGEYGKSWHEAGTKLKKQNVFDDFIAAAEWLIDNGYTRPERLAMKVKPSSFCSE